MAAQSACTWKGTVLTPSPHIHTLTLECSKHTYKQVYAYTSQQLKASVRIRQNYRPTAVSSVRDKLLIRSINTGRSQISYRYTHARTFQNPKLFVDVYEFECAPRSPSFLLRQAVVDVALISRRLAHLTQPDSDNPNHQTSGITSTYNSRHLQDKLVRGRLQRTFMQSF